MLDACQANYHPHQEQSIDEAMARFKGHSSIKQYLLKKPTKIRFKICVRVDGHNDYKCQFDCYTGSVGVEGFVVRRLKRDLVGKGYNIFMDSFFQCKFV